MSQTLRDLAQAAATRLEVAGIDSAARDARLLLAHATGFGAARLGAEMGEGAAPDVVAAFEQMVARRLTREPVSHIIGKRWFFNHEFQVTAAVLDPRPETEALVLAALGAPFGRVLDLGTGSGAIVLSLLAERPDATGVGTDLSRAALAVAEENARRLALSDRCEFQRHDWFAGVTGRFDLIVSNPPYIAADEMPDLAPELCHEPQMALTDTLDGLSAYRKICEGAPAHLAPDGRLMVEIGCSQGAQVAGMMTAAGLRDVTVLPDLDGRDRVVLAHADR
ncbi:peptide chain release factor N(5)-glutamine methyltransferase [Roseovarius dicentrarchi]|uniref:peptide chain release factor N(5)-glutamine methyltransferase n=1 Tax=Roseovarius dicentrarchi TaxID=2250573 RepID=UPI001EF114B9|nr:peptide chain release factor N(5)-glutamine methyltransferase [Roseovarius dicentrarchi]